MTQLGEPLPALVRGIQVYEQDRQVRVAIEARQGDGRHQLRVDVDDDGDVGLVDDVRWNWRQRRRNALGRHGSTPQLWAGTVRFSCLRRALIGVEAAQIPG